MSEVVMKGIEQAQGELQRESDEAIWQEGILRHVPLVGSFYNWISPVQKVQFLLILLSLDKSLLLVLPFSASNQGKVLDLTRGQIGVH